MGAEENSENKKNKNLGYIKHINNDDMFSPVSPKTLRNRAIIILDQTENSICKIIKSDNKGSGTGFLCKIPFPDSFNLLPVLVTCHHVLENEIIIKGSKIKIQFKNEEKTNDILITLDNNRKIYEDKENDIIFIEIKEKDGINMKISFLDIDDYYIKKMI